MKKTIITSLIALTSSSAFAWKYDHVEWSKQDAERIKAESAQEFYPTAQAYVNQMQPKMPVTVDEYMHINSIEASQSSKVITFNMEVEADMDKFVNGKEKDDYSWSRGKMLDFYMVHFCGNPMRRAWIEGGVNMALNIRDQNGLDYVHYEVINKTCD